MHLAATLNRRRPWLARVALVAGAAALALSLVACSTSDEPESSGAPTASTQDAQALADTFITLLQQKDANELRTFLADSFMVQRADGSFQVKADYLTNLPTIGEFSISNVVSTQTGDVLVVRWDLTVNETINGANFATVPAPRLSTFVWNGDEWQLASHANFNAPPSPTVPAAPVN